MDHARTDQIRQQKCLAMLVCITTLWVTEGLPYFATAMLVPPMVVFLNILDDPDDAGVPLTSSMDYVFYNFYCRA